MMRKKFCLLVVVMIASWAGLAGQCSVMHNVCVDAYEIDISNGLSQVCNTVCVPGGSFGDQICNQAGTEVSWFRIETDGTRSILELQISGISGSLEVHEDNCGNVLKSCTSFTSGDIIDIRNTTSSRFFLAVQTSMVNIDFDLCSRTYCPTPSVVASQSAGNTCNSENEVWFSVETTSDMFADISVSNISVTSSFQADLFVNGTCNSPVQTLTSSGTFNSVLGCASLILVRISSNESGCGDVNVSTSFGQCASRGGPVDPDPSDPWPSSNIFLGCPNDPLVWPTFNLQDPCTEDIYQVTDGDYGVFIINEANCFNSGLAELEFETDCGDITTHQIEYNLVQTSGSLMSLNTTSDLMYGIGFTECDGLSCYSFTEAGGNYHDNPINITTSFNAFPQIGVDFAGGCPPYEISVSHTPGGGPPGDPSIFWAGAQDCIPYDEPTTVQWEIFDQCGNNPLLIEFEVLIECSACPGNGIIAPERCNTCEETDPSAIPNPDCHACDSEALSFQSCTPTDPELGGQPPTLCMGVGVPHNMSWFSFIAGSQDIEVEVNPLDCFAGTGAVGIQAGIYDECFTNGGNCLAGDASCTNNLSPKTFSLNNLTPGETYFIFVDGCNGAACNYVITVEEQEPFVVHTPVAVVSESCGESFGDCDIENEMQVCPGSPMNFTVWHDGDGTGDEGSCTPYNPDSEGLLFLWNTYDGDMNELDWAGIGTGFTAEFSIINDGFRLPEDILAPTVPGVYNICIEQVSRPPCTFAANQACMEITVQDPPVETYAWEVCVEDLEVGGPNTFGPFDPGLGGTVNPNADNYAWLGMDVSRADVESWTETNADWPGHICNTFLNMDPVCGCIIPQQVCINMRGDLDKTDILAYMYECQFYDFQNQGHLHLISI